MKYDISLKDILEFQKEYSVEENKKVEKAIRIHGIEKASINRALLDNHDYHFNIEIPEVKIYNQNGSYQCNIFAFLRVVKSIIMEENQMDTINLDLSANYISFYDKLEKINTIYNYLIKREDISVEIINQVVDRYLGNFGTFHFCRELVKKYGLVPTYTMEEVKSNYNANQVIEIIKAKVKTDALVLIDKKNVNQATIKKVLMQNAYDCLSKIIGNPPTMFTFDSKNYTPLSFKEAILKTDLDEFITVTPFKKEIFLNSYSYIPNIYLNDTEKIVSLPLDKIRDAVVKQLEDGIAIWFSSEESTALDYDLNILDPTIYKYKELFEIKNTSKANTLLLNLINYDHAMCITGAFVKQGCVIQYKVDNSFGEHGQYKGHLIMTNDFLEQCVLTLIIHKKYLK